MKTVKVFTNSTFNETVQIERYLQPVTYHVVLGVNFFADFLSGFTDFFGGKSQSYQTRLTAINKEVIEGIQKKVHEIGGNAAIDLKIDNDEISAQGKSMIMVTAIATAVVVKYDDKKVEYDSKIKDSIGAISLEEYMNYKDKLYFKAKLKILKHGGPIARLITEIKPENFDLLPEIFECIRNAEASPKDFPQEAKNALRTMLNTLDYGKRSDFFYKELSLLIDTSNSIDFRNGKISFINNEIFESNSVNYEKINEILVTNTEDVKTFLLPHYKESIEKKIVFYPSDIIHLEKAKEICANNNYEDSVIAIIDVLIESLTKILNSEYIVACASFLGVSRELTLVYINE